MNCKFDFFVFFIGVTLIQVTHLNIVTRNLITVDYPETVFIHKYSNRKCGSN